MFKKELNAMLKSCELEKDDLSQHKRTKNLMKERVEKALFLQSLLDDIDHEHTAKEDYPAFPESMSQFCEFENDEKGLKAFGRTAFVSKRSSDKNKILENERLRLKVIAQKLMDALVELRGIKPSSATKKAEKLRQENNEIKRENKQLVSQLLNLKEQVKLLEDRLRSKDMQIEELMKSLNDRKASVHVLR
jgi:hypothetical protein|tara:strand:+ start:4472 stop:5044 length:573 start_codon:yes stop_codon:yes gene_type:complete